LLITLGKILQFDIVYLQKTISPTGLILCRLAKRMGKKVIFDLDDNMFVIAPALTTSLAKVSDLVVVGSHYLFDLVASIRNEESVRLIPSGVDTSIFSPCMCCRKEPPLTLGWHGSGLPHLPYLRLLVEPLSILSRRYDLTLRTVGIRRDAVRDVFGELANLKLEVKERWYDYNFLPRVLSSIDIGLMPLINDSWSRGKCGMKILDYMALGIPVVASKVGENMHIVKDGKNGFLAASSEEWIKKLSLLIEDFELRKKLASNALRTVTQKYALSVVALQLLGSLENLVQHSQ